MANYHRLREGTSYEALSAACAGRIKPKMLEAIFSGRAGVKLDHLDDFLASLNRRAVHKDAVCLRPEEYTALVIAMDKLAFFLRRFDELRKRGVDIKQIMDLTEE